MFDGYVHTSSSFWSPKDALRYKELKETIVKEEGEEDGEELEEGEEGEEGEEHSVPIEVSSSLQFNNNHHNKELDCRNSNNDIEGSEPSSPQHSGFLSVCAIDCEMCYTSIGLELTRVSTEWLHCT